MGKTLKQILKENGAPYSGEAFAYRKNKRLDEILKSEYDITDVKKDLESIIRPEAFTTDLETVGKTVNEISNNWQTQEKMKNTRYTIEAMKNRISAFQEYQKVFGGEKAVDISDLSNSYNKVLNDWDSLAKSYGYYQNAGFKVY